MSTRMLTTLSVLALAAGAAACSDSMGPRAQRASGGTIQASSTARLELTTTFTNGKARFRSRDNQQELQIEVEDLRPGTMVTFAVDGIVVGSVAADAFGSARINLNTALGDVFPAGLDIHAGSVVSVIVAGSTIASGTLS